MEKDSRHLARKLKRKHIKSPIYFQELHYNLRFEEKKLIDFFLS